MLKTHKLKLVLVILTYLAFQSVAIANDHSNKSATSQCDVVSISGTGSLQKDGSIVGNETLTVIGSGKSASLSFHAVTLGALELDPATSRVTLAASHDFASVESGKFNFTTFDEINIIPLGGSDASCTQNACGLLFKLKLERGHGRYNCGEIVSGFNMDPAAAIPFTSFIDPSNPDPNGGTVRLSSFGKLCKCDGKD